MATTPFNNPFSSLATQREALPQATVPQAAPAPLIRKAPKRAVLRLERKGHGGKEATVIDKLELDGQGLASLLKALKKSLGCGGAVLGETIVLQGDQRERASALLRERGVGQVTVG